MAKINLEEQFRLSDMIPVGMSTASKMVKRLASSPIRAGEAIGKAGAKQVAEEARYAREVGANKYAKELGRNIAADLAGQLEESQPAYSIYRALKGDKPIREKVLGDTKSLPASTLLTEAFSPVVASKAGKVIKALEGLPVGMSIKPVSEESQPFIGYITKSGDNEMFSHSAAKDADYHHSFLVKNLDDYDKDSSLRFVRMGGENRFTLTGDSAIDPYHPESKEQISMLAKKLIDSGADPNAPFVISDMALPFEQAPYQNKEIGKLSDWYIEKPKSVNFVSSVERAIKGHKMESMNGEQWANWMRANASKSAKKEAEATGLYDWLKSQGKVSKADIEEYVELNLPKFQKTEYGFGSRKLTPEQEERLAILEHENAKMPLGAIDDIYGEGTYDELIQLQNIRDKATTEKLYQLQPELERKANIAQQRGDKELAKKYWDEINHITARVEHLELKDTVNKPRFERFKEPGGENYREVTLSLPKPMKEYNQFIDKIKEKYGEGPLDSLPLTAAEKRTLENLYAKEERGLYRVPESHTYGDDASDINRLLHYRANERLTPEGKKVSFLEELQADWAQQGRKYGFGEGVTIKQDANGMYRAYDINGNLIELRAEGGPYVAMNTEDAVRKALANSYYSKGLPTAPYVTDTGDWTKLGLKHALKDAIEQGHDYLAWTTGEQQAARYDLSKQVGAINFYEHPEGSNRFVVKDINGDEIVNEQNIKPERLEEFVGKEYAEKLMNQEPRKYFRSSSQQEPSYYRELTDENLRIGGEGMKGYYDKIVPQSVRDILKEYGIKNDVMPIEIQMERAIDESGMPSMYPSKSTNMGIEITPELREKIMNEGLPYFKSGGKVNPIDLETQFRLANILARY